MTLEQQRKLAEAYGEFNGLTHQQAHNAALAHVGDGFVVATSAPQMVHWSVPSDPASYGEQCADTDGLAVLAVVPDFSEHAISLAYANAQIDKLTLRAEAAERNLEATIRERDALRAELNQRMAIPARALKFGGIR